MNKVNNSAKGIVGKRAGGDPVEEKDHFFNCNSCGQAVDMRDLGQVAHHEGFEHKPIDCDA